MTRLRRGRAIVAVIFVLAFCAVAPAGAYLKLGTRLGGRVVSLRWNRTPVRYFVNIGGVAGVSADQLQAAVDRAFRTWQNLDTSDITFEFGGFTTAVPLQEDGFSTLGFVNRPELSRALAQTSFLIDTTTGEIVESDVFFNATFPWSVAQGGEPDRFDVESIALHEVGHLIGLGHSAIGETELRSGGGRRVLAAGAVMFPIAFSAGNISGRDPMRDDITGLSDVYPASDLRERTGSITGRVVKNGAAVIGAHVVAFSLQDGSLVGGFATESDGGFTISALNPGVYVVRVEPLDDASIESFFSDIGRVDIDFRVTYHERLVIVPKGGGSGPLEIRVTPK